MEKLNDWMNSLSRQTSDLTNNLTSELDDHLLSAPALMQFGIFTISAILAYILARPVSTLFKAWLARRNRKFIFHVYAAPRELFFLFFISAFLWLAVLGLALAGQDLILLKTMASLVTAWGVIRLVSGTIANRLWARIIAVILWTIVTLGILDLLDPITALLDSAAVSFGKVRISLLVIVKALIIFSLLIWIMGIVTRVLERGFTTVSGLTSSQRVLFYKLSTISLYAIAGFIGLNMIGLDLTALAVFGGGLGLGIGFGLQKIFSNLISGIILLIDKSVKPGDVIAINETYGWVNSLGARYVSVLTRDGKEHLIPNEKVISDQVENWSYSDPNIRIHVPVRVSYQSDIHQVRDLILKAAEDSPRVLKSHMPVCLIKAFDDDGIHFELRIWIADPQEGVSNIKSEIYFRIWDLFKEHDVAIPFPQRDIHLKLDEDIIQALLQFKGLQNG